MLRAFLLCLVVPFVAATAGQLSYSATDANGIALDRKLFERMNFRNGTFIEVGANDGIIQSNTKLLEERYGWTGILVEPSQSLFAKLSKNRPNSICFCCALGSFAQDNTYLFGDFDGSEMSSIGGERLMRPAQQQVKIRSLQSILDEVGLQHIHFFSLDTEGYEFNILNGIDFSKTTFDYLLIEIYAADYDKIVSFLSTKGYKMIENFSGYNYESNPRWDGTHNDYLFMRKALIIN